MALTFEAAAPKPRSAAREPTRQSAASSSVTKSFLRLPSSRIITRLSRVVIVWCSTIFALSQGAERPAFSAIAPVIDELRHSAGTNLVVHIGASGFEILKEVTTPITSTEARAARTELRKHGSGLPSIRFTKTHEIAAYDLDPRTVIEVEIDTTPEKWTRRRLESIATYPDSAWERFIEFCLRNGMTELTVYEQGDARFGEITFASVGPATIGYPGGSLHLSPAFYEDARVSPDYPASAGTNGFVILIHGPHQDVGERFHLMSGLAALSTANPALKFEYLVEGAFPGLAIDDNRFLGKPGATSVEPFKIEAALTALAEFAAPSDPENPNSEEAAARGMIREGVYMTAALQRADSTNLTDTQMIKHLERLKASFGALGDVASEISKSVPEMHAYADALETQSTAYSTEAQKYKDALQRNETMLPFIEAAGRNCAKKLPLVFIGSSHTEAITRRLRTDGIGYVVIEPRRLAPYNHIDRDQKRFEDLHDPDATDMGNINLNRLQLAVASNGWLVDSVVEIGKENGLDGAFAFFDEADGKPRLVLLDKDSERWRGEDRYARLRVAMFALPYAGKGQTAVIHFVRLPAGKSSSREYYSIYKPDSKRVYLVEGSISSVASVLRLSTVRARGSVDIHVQLGELLNRAANVEFHADWDPAHGYNGNAIFSTHFLYFSG